MILPALQLVLNESMRMYANVHKNWKNLQSPIVSMRVRLDLSIKNMVIIIALKVKHYFSFNNFSTD